MVKRYRRFSFNRQLENFNAIGEGLIGGFAGWISGGGQAGVEAGFSTGYSDARSFQRRRKKWLKKSVIGSARSLYGSKPIGMRNPVYGSNPKPPVYGSPPQDPKAPPIAWKLQAAGCPQIVDLQPLEGSWRG